MKVWLLKRKAWKEDKIFLSMKEAHRGILSRKNQSQASSGERSQWLLSLINETPVTWDYISVTVFKCNFLAELVLVSVLNVCKEKHFNNVQFCVRRLRGTSPLVHNALCSSRQ